MRAIVLTSGKGGVGKTTLAVGLGRALAALGMRVGLLDADIGLNNLDVLTGVDGKVVYDLTDVVENRCRLRQALVPDREAKGLYVLPSVHSYDHGRIDGQSIRAVVNGLKSLMDIVLLDCPAGIETGFHRAVSAADEAIIVTTPHISALRDASKVIGLLRSYSLRSVSAILNRARGDLEYFGETVTAAETEEILGVPVIGCIPEDDGLNLMSAGFSGGRGAGAEAIRLTCECLLGLSGEVYDAGKKYRGLIGSIRRRMKKLS